MVKITIAEKTLKALKVFGIVIGLAMVGFFLGEILPARAYLVIIIGLAILTIVALIVFLFIYRVLAPKNIFFTIVKEGTAKTIVRGGKFRKVLIQWEKCTLDQEDWNVVDVVDVDKKHRRKLRLFGGLHFFWFWPLDRIYTYNFEWKGLESDGITPHPYKEELLDNIFLKQYVYYSEVKEAEDVDRLPLDIYYVLTIRIQNPYKALFKVHKWLNVVFGRIAPEIRNVIAQKPYEKLITDLEGLTNELKKNIKEPKNGMAEGDAKGIIDTLKDQYGVEVLDVKVLDIDPPKEQREATLLEFKAKQEQKQIQIRANAERVKRTTEAQGEANAIRKVSKAQAERFKVFKEVDPELAALALDTAGKVEPNKIVLIGKDLGDAARNLGNFLGHKKPESLGSGS